MANDPSAHPSLQEPNRSPNPTRLQLDAVRRIRSRLKGQAIRRRQKNPHRNLSERFQVLLRWNLELEQTWLPKDEIQDPKEEGDQHHAVQLGPNPGPNAGDFNPYMTEEAEVKAEAAANGKRKAYEPPTRDLYMTDRDLADLSRCKRLNVREFLARAYLWYKALLSPVKIRYNMDDDDYFIAQRDAEIANSIVFPNYVARKLQIVGLTLVQQLAALDHFDATKGENSWKLFLSMEKPFAKLWVEHVLANPGEGKAQQSQGNA